MVQPAPPPPLHAAAVDPGIEAICQKIGLEITDSRRIACVLAVHGYGGAARRAGRGRVVIRTVTQQL